MKTIRQRAAEFIKQRGFNLTQNPFMQGMIESIAYLCYEQGAKDQEEIENKLFESFLSGLKDDNTGEETERKYNRLWEEYKATNSQ